MKVVSGKEQGARVSVGDEIRSTATSLAITITTRLGFFDLLATTPWDGQIRITRLC